MPVGVPPNDRGQHDAGAGGRTEPCARTTWCSLERDHIGECLSIPRAKHPAPDFGPRRRDKPAAATARPAGWRAVFGLEAGATLVDAKAAHRRLIATNHPDVGGSHEIAVKLNAALVEAEKEFGGG